MDRKNKSEVGGISMARLLAGLVIAACVSSGLTGCVVNENLNKSTNDGQWPNDVIVRELGFLTDRVGKIENMHKVPLEKMPVWFKVQVELNRSQINVNRKIVDQFDLLMAEINAIKERLNGLQSKLVQEAV